MYLVFFFPRQSVERLKVFTNQEYGCCSRIIYQQKYGNPGPLWACLILNVDFCMERGNEFTDLITRTRTAEEPSLLLGVVAKLPVSATLKLVKLSSLQDKYAWISCKFLSNASKSPGFTAWVTLRVTAGVRGWFNQEWRYSCFKMGSWNRFPFPPFAKPSVEAVPEHGTQHPNDFGGSVAMWEFRGMKTRLKFTDRWFTV